ncbi:MAG: hypothetical protein A3D16_09875 [Rhodobacterales bacterium RIFCSPHIGHO2_02_FULL_62_130]|nr:MAG: hypothetical protein A3D16_09875 [Rhodobacterales bacterium RIFCSPHIGHO2_02_FULL_62_130]OHC56319.1 MAG: hypothetical protein A3E48_20800 [Rhodobacterales bacterium RIFCSPHIGHO2_12_FULL_62_75]
MNGLKRLMVEAMRRHMTTGKPPAMPLAGVALWQVFAAISPGRGWHAHGPQPLTLAEIREQGEAMGLPLELRHIDVIRALDGCWLECQAKGGAGAPLQELTPEIFDAMFS